MRGLDVEFHSFCLRFCPHKDGRYQEKDFHSTVRQMYYSKLHPFVREQNSIVDSNSLNMTTRVSFSEDNLNLPRYSGVGVVVDKPCRILRTDYRRGCALDSHLGLTVMEGVLRPYIPSLWVLVEAADLSQKIVSCTQNLPF